MIDAPVLAARGLTLRAAVTKDAEFERVLFESARPDGTLLAAVLPATTRKFFLDQQFHCQSVHYARAHPDADRLIVLAGTVSIGRLLVDRDGNGWCLIDIALLPDARGQGIGTVLLQGVLAAAARAAAPRVRLSVAPNNPARRLYERLGFAVVGASSSSTAMEWHSRDAQLKTA